MVTKGNPYHLPGGSPQGGEFTHGPDSAKAKSTEKQHLPRKQRRNFTDEELLRHSRLAQEHSAYNILGKKNEDKPLAGLKYTKADTNRMFELLRKK